MEGEHLWLTYSGIAFFVLPLILALATIPQLSAVYGSSQTTVVLTTALFGAGWGVGSVFFGLGVDALGMALGFSMMTGLYTALGALVPLLVLTPDLIPTVTGFYIIAGNIVMIVGVVFCAVAGERRDRLMGDKVAPGTLNPKRSVAAGLTICILAGIFSAMFNFAYAFGRPIAETAVTLGAATVEDGLNAVWLIALPAGGLINIGYCMILLQRRRSWSLLRCAHPVDWCNAAIMSVLWTGSVIIYGWGATHMGRLGPSLGWSLWNAILIITTVVCGLLTREWEGIRGPPLHLLFVGIIVLIVATVMLGLGGPGG